MHEARAAGSNSCGAGPYAERHGWEVGGPKVDVTYDPESTPRKFEVQLQLPADLSDEQRGRLERVAVTCPLRRALEAGSPLKSERVFAAQGAEAA